MFVAQIRIAVTQRSRAAKIAMVCSSEERLRFQSRLEIGQNEL